MLTSLLSFPPTRPVFSRNPRKSSDPDFGNMLSGGRGGGVLAFLHTRLPAWWAPPPDLTLRTSAVSHMCNRTTEKLLFALETPTDDLRRQQQHARACAQRRTRPAGMLRNATQNRLLSSGVFLPPRDAKLSRSAFLTDRRGCDWTFILEVTRKLHGH